MVADALESWLRDYRGAHPQTETAWIFLRSEPRRAALGAFEVLRQQWLDAVYAIREPRVAATKLQWWVEELQHAGNGQARHPLTQALLADERVRAIPQAHWQEALLAAFRELEAAPASDFAAQLAQAASLHGALARIETAVWFGAAGDPRRMQALAPVQHLAAMLRNLPMEVDRGCTPLPMSLLARHDLSQDDLLQDGPSRRAALRDQIRDVLQAMTEADKMPGPLSLFRGLQQRLDRHALRRAMRAREPLRELQRRPGGFGALIDAWSAARACRSAMRP